MSPSRWSREGTITRCLNTRAGGHVSELGLGTPETRATSRHVRRRRSHSALATVLALVVVAGLLGAAAYFGRSALSGLFSGDDSVEDFPGPGTGSVSVHVAPGDSVTTIGGTLVEAGVIATRDAFLDAAAGHPAGTTIQPGTYELRLEMSAAGALGVLVNPANRQVEVVTVPEGLRLGETLTRLSDGADVPLAELEAAAADAAAIGLPAYADGNAEGFLFPATYEFEPDATAAEMLTAMVTRFGQAATTVSLESGSEALGRTPLEIVTIASIIESETSRAEDMAKAARVIYNRLAVGMRLQMDSTVSYAVGSSGSVFTTEEERQTDSPYNTYRYEGLPPGAISSPGEAALAAAMAPAAGDWLYFVTVDLDTGETRFARTPEEHQANVALLQQYCQGSDLC